METVTVANEFAMKSLEAVRITSITCAPLRGQSPKGGWSTEIQPDDSIHALIAVHTDAGVTGYGSVFTNGALAQAGVKLLLPLVLGENPLEPSRVCEKLHQNTFWMGRGGTLTHVISGIDIAMWDILGKVTGLSVSVLLGGRHQDKVRPYCSLLMDEPVAMTDVLLEFKEKGYRAFKIGWGPFGRRDSFDHDEAIIHAARAAIGSEADLLVDAGASDAYWSNGLLWAKRTAEMLYSFAVGWFEEPLKPDALDDFVSLRQHSPVKIAGGEVLTRRQSFKPFLEQGAFDVVQPDVTKVGGISEQRRIVWMAHDHGVEYVGHGWNTALGLASDLQMASSFPGTRYVEYIGGSPYVDGLLKSPFKLDEDGNLAIPNSPGLGIELDFDRLAEFVDDVDCLLPKCNH